MGGNKTEIKYKYAEKFLFLALFLFSVVFVIFSNFGTVSADQSVIYVNGSGGNDSWDGQSATWTYGTTNGPKLSIKNATGTVNAKGTIYIANGNYAGVNNTNITISRNMTIVGQSQDRTIINGEHTNWIFSIPFGVNVTIQNLTIANGTASNGGAIANNGTIGSLSGCTFINNTAAYTGGAIYNYENITDVSGCTFSGNTANDGGAIYNDWSSTINSVSGCTFSGNTANDAGAIYNGGYSNVTLSDCTFINNTANGVGGAIYNMKDNFGEGTITNLTGCTFKNNTATNGGAIENDGTITGLSYCNFINNRASDSGGAIYNMKTITNLSGCTFINNTANGVGGAIYSKGTIGGLSGCIFTGNTAARGGAIDNGNTISSVSGCTFTNNTATNYGGAIYNNGGTLTVKGNTFKVNTAVAGGILYNDNNGTATLNFNRIVGNNPNWSEICSVSKIVDATLNWWGSNDNPSVYVNSNVNVASWMILHVIAIPNAILNGSNSAVTANLCFDNLNNYYDPANGHVPDGTPVTFTGNLGSFNQPSTALVNGITTSVFTANSAGTGSINAVVDDQTASASVTVDAPPVVSYSDPTNNAKINVKGKTITITFSEPIQAGSAYNSITVTGPSGTVSMIPSINGNTLTLTPASNYADGIYTVNIPVNAVMDLAGNGITTAFTSSFTVDTVPPTAGVNVPGGLYNTNKVITLSLSKLGTIYYTTDGSMPTTASRQYVSPIAVSSTTTLKFIAVDTAGNTSPVYAQTYTIDKIAPKVISTNPKKGATGISRTKVITIKFSENIARSINWSKIVVKNKYGHAVSISKSIKGNTIYIKTNSKRLSKAYYTVYIPKSAIKDYAGNNSAAMYTFRFKTGK